MLSVIDTDALQINSCELLNVVVMRFDNISTQISLIRADVRSLTGNQKEMHH